MDVTDHFVVTVFAQGITYDYLEGCLLITGSQWSSASKDVFYEIWL